jgi:thiamine-monophosphate kinase
VTPEFGLIAKYFSRPVKRALLGVGDDCALLLAPTTAQATAISTDTLVAGVHFFADVDAAALGHKALAVNLSDLAAMGATPRYFTLALTLPAVDDAWLAKFAAGLNALADAHDIELVGGDTTRGPLAITITVLGDVDPTLALRRDRARVGDDIWVSGSLGGAALALEMLQTKQPHILPSLLALLERPVPRVALGCALLGIANAAIDISDGLVADLGHITARSGLRATIEWREVPRHPDLQPMGRDSQAGYALCGGDDYELCFTAGVDARTAIEHVSRNVGLPLTRIGSLSTGAAEVAVNDESGRQMHLPRVGFDHFSPPSHHTDRA